jgi:hypothetical protein
MIYQSHLNMIAGMFTFLWLVISVFCAKNGFLTFEKTFEKIEWKIWAPK